MSETDSDLQLEGGKAQGWYDTACNDYQDVEVERTANLNNMQKIVSRLLKKGNIATGTQTDPIEGFELYGGVGGAAGAATSNELASEPE